MLLHVFLNPNPYLAKGWGDGCGWSAGEAASRSPARQGPPFCALTCRLDLDDLTWVGLLGCGLWALAQAQAQGRPFNNPRGTARKISAGLESPEGWRGTAYSLRIVHHADLHQPGSCICRPWVSSKPNIKLEIHDPSFQRHFINTTLTSCELARAELASKCKLRSLDLLVIKVSGSG